MVPDNWSVPDSVYRPSDDTSLFQSVLTDVDLSGETILDVGTGSGILAYTAAEQGGEVTAVDINAEAVAAARKNLERHGHGDVDVFVSDLFGSVTGHFDGIIFNPPYVPVGREMGTMKERAWAGGEHGREVIDRFLAGFHRHLAPGGRVFLLQLERNGVDVTRDRFRERGFRVEQVAVEKLPWERLVVLRATVSSDGG